MTDHLVYNREAQEQRFADNNAYSYFRTLADAIKATRLAILYGTRTIVNGKTVFRYTGSQLNGIRSFVHGNMIRNVQANEVVVVFDSSCRPVSSYVS